MRERRLKPTSRCLNEEAITNRLDAWYDDPYGVYRNIMAYQALGWSEEEYDVWTNTGKIPKGF